MPHLGRRGEDLRRSPATPSPPPGYRLPLLLHGRMQRQVEREEEEEEVGRGSVIDF